MDQLEKEEAEEEQRQQQTSNRHRLDVRSSAPPTKLKPSLPLQRPVPGIPLPKGASSGLVPDIVERTPTAPTQISSSNPPREASISKPRSSKSVSFAPDVISQKADVDSLPARPAKGSQDESWGDVVPGALRDAKHESLKALSMQVVERAPPPGTDADLENQPRKLAFKPRKVQLRQVEVDSDDEDPESEEDDGSTLGSNHDRDSEDEDGGGNDDDDNDEEEDDDWDEAMLQRELALAYYETQGMLKELRHSAVAPPPPIISADLGSWEQEVRRLFAPSRYS